ncbi:GTPase HflX [Geodermatophilus sp. SYSU D01036]
MCAARGEQRLESQRRHQRRRTTVLRRQVEQTAARRQRTRSRRRSSRVPSVALTGHTNAGWSALLNRLTGAEVLVQDALFATLDPTVRRAVTPDGRPCTLTDTVGFVRHVPHLPHQLVDAFRATLEEVAEAALVLHVVDASAPDATGQVTAVRGVLCEIGARDHPELLALDEADVAPPAWMAPLCTAYPDAVPVSALTGEGVEDLPAAITRALER